MIMSRRAAALAIPCACLLAAPALSQPGAVYGPQEPPASRITPIAKPDSDAPRAPVVAQPPADAPAAMLESWELGEGAQFGIGRFRVGEIARGRTNTERLRENPLHRENRAIAGAGLSIRFR